MSDPGTPVLVVGAGPTGLLLAAELARRDVGCLLIDALDAPRGWDRATVVHERSLQIFEALGIADGFLDAGVRTRASRIFSDGELLGEVDLGLTGSRYGFQLGMSEEVTESLLTEHLVAHGGAVNRSTVLVGLAPGEDGVTATLERDGERRDVVVGWVVGCDWMHSAVREAAGIAFPGADIDARWGVFDATVDGWSDDHDVVFAHLDRPPVILTGQGTAFSAGGDLGEFGTAADPGAAHLIRTLRSPARLARQLGVRLTVAVHGACVGAGIEVPAGAARVTARPGAVSSFNRACRACSLRRRGR